MTTPFQQFSTGHYDAFDRADEALLRAAWNAAVDKAHECAAASLDVGVRVKIAKLKEPEP